MHFGVVLAGTIVPVIIMQIVSRKANGYQLSIIRYPSFVKASLSVLINIRNKE